MLCVTCGESKCRSRALTQQIRSSHPFSNLLRKKSTINLLRCRGIPVQVYAATLDVLTSLAPEKHLGVEACDGHVQPIVHHRISGLLQIGLVAALQVMVAGQGEVYHHGRPPCQGGGLPAAPGFNPVSPARTWGYAFLLNLGPPQSFRRRFSWFEMDNVQICT